MASPVRRIKHSKVVVGSSPEAVAYAKKNKIPVILPNDEYPFRFDCHEGRPKIEEWSKNLWELGMEGLNPFSRPVDHVSIDEEKIRITYDRTNVIDIDYEDCYLFETDGVKHDLEISEERDSLYRVIDWFAVDRCERHNKDRIRTEDDFVKEIIFHQSDRIDGNHDYKDIAAVSYLEEDQLTEFDFSDTMAVFKVRHHLLDHGVRGRVSYYDKKGVAHRYKVRLKPLLREKELVRGNLYSSSEKVHFCADMKLREILGGKIT